MPDGNNTTCNECLYEGYELTHFHMSVWCFLYSLVAVLALVGNVVTVVVVLRQPHMRTVTNVFIVNLAISDTITALVVIPLKVQAAMLQQWKLPSVLCSIVPYVETVCLTVSVLTLCATAIDRYRAVSMQPVSQLRHAVVSVCSIWSVSVVLSSPVGLFHRVRMDNGVQYCVPIAAGEHWWKIYNIYLAVVQYLVPLLVVVGTFLLIAIKFQHHRTISLEDSMVASSFGKSMKKVIIMLGIVVITFAFCWLPLEVYLVLAELDSRINEFYYINVVFFCFHWLAMCNSCLNPIIFYLFHAGFRREYERAIRVCICRRSDSTDEAVLDKEMLSVLVRLSDQLVSSRRHSSRARARALSLYHCHHYIINELGMKLPDPQSPTSDGLPSTERSTAVSLQEKYIRMATKFSATEIPNSTLLPPCSQSNASSL